MYLFDNTFNDIRDVNGYSKDELLNVKKEISRLKSDKIELENFLSVQFQSELKSFYKQYVENIQKFIEQYLISDSTKRYYFNLKNQIHSELKLISSNLSNLIANGRNVKRFLKNNPYLNNFLTQAKNLKDEIETINSILRRHTEKIEKEYEDYTTIWIDLSKTKNLNYKLSELLDSFDDWEELRDLKQFLKSLVEAKTKRKSKSKKEINLTFNFNELYQYFLSKYDKNMDAYDDLIYLLYNNKIFEEFEGEEFINVIERKEIVRKLKNKVRPIILSLIKDKLENIINEVIKFDKKYDLNGQKGKINVENLMQDKFRIFLPKILDFYFVGLDNKFQIHVKKVDDQNTKEFIKIVDSYYSKMDNLLVLIDEIDNWLLKFDQFIKPFQNITDKLKKSLSGLTSEINRRREEYMSYLNSIKDEGLRVDIRAYVDDKISEVNKLISSYEDETSKIIKEELPQLRQIRELLSDYKSKIEKVKEEVYDKLNTYKDSNIDMYSVVKHWEDNFIRKKQQLTFLLTLLINKIFKSFKDLIDEESILFAEITEITKQTEEFEGLPLNFALSAFLAERLTEDELRERISEINAKINQITSSLGLYQIERAKLEEILTKKVKIRQGVAVSKIQCTICHKNINFAQDKLITCPFCGSTYHYLCVADWISKQNSCPMCMNHFLEPYSNLFENNES